jgi:hypothetical protein
LADCNAPLWCGGLSHKCPVDSQTTITPQCVESTTADGLLTCSLTRHCWLMSADVCSLSLTARPTGACCLLAAECWSAGCSGCCLIPARLLAACIGSYSSPTHLPWASPTFLVARAMRCWTAVALLTFLVDDGVWQHVQSLCEKWRENCTCWRALTLSFANAVFLISAVVPHHMAHDV